MIKEYIVRLFRVVLTDEQEEKLIQYLFGKVDEISDLNSLKNLILDYLMNTLGLKPTLTFSNDNSDLEQMLKLIKVKAEKDEK
ncbi:protein of unknown function [Petrocella atlantisensis]|uniref:Uncharacterized protein n=1 Tax=Petrocella atlantisensis TaxID=2173034 RepID=A0A3P7PGU2_9FIRM|nr:hypothetical protein [Petrocella atlantisensis]VDN49243.1 protein of unknown function [Petrocella atlantisensis]